MIPAKQKHARRWAMTTLLILVAITVFVKETAADTTEGDRESAKFTIENMSVQKVPAIFKFQSRVSQGKIPLGDTEFKKVYVHISNGSKKLCTEIYSDIPIVDSVLNLDIGTATGGTCDMDTIVTVYNQLFFEVCLTNEDNCLKPISFATVPYAVKSSYSYHANKAAKANEAVQCHYAHRVTADKELFVTENAMAGKGYYDFYTPAEDYFATNSTTGTYENPSTRDLMFWYEEGAQSINSYSKGGYIQWAGVDPSGNNLHLCATDPNDMNGLPIPLEELVMHADLSRVAGVLKVEGSPNNTGKGAYIAGGAQLTGVTLLLGDTKAMGAHDEHVVVGQLKDNYRMVIWDKLDIRGTADFYEDAYFNKTLSVGAVGTTPLETDSDIFEVWGNASFKGKVNIAAGAELSIPPGSVGTVEIANNSITTEKIGKGAVVSDDIYDGTITSVDIANGAIISEKMGVDSIKSNAIKMEAVDSIKIKNNSIQAEDIAANAIGFDEMANEAIGYYEMRHNAIGKNEMRDNAIGSSEIIDNSIGAVDIAPNAVGASELASNAVGTSALQNESVTVSKMKMNRHTYTLKAKWCGSGGAGDANPSGNCDKKVFHKNWFKMCFLTGFVINTTCKIYLDSDDFWHIYAYGSGECTMTCIH